MPAQIDIEGLRNALAALGVISNGPAVEPDAALSFKLVGAAEIQALMAQQASVEAGAISTEVVARLTAETLAAAGCESELDALDLLRWRATCLSHALEYIDVGGPRGVVDPMMHAIVVTAGALAGLMTAAHKMRDPGSGPADTQDAAEGWWAAIASLREVAHMSPTQASYDDHCDCDSPTGS